LYENCNTVSMKDVISIREVILFYLFTIYVVSNYNVVGYVMSNHGYADRIRLQ